MKAKTYRYIVQGRGSFPVDMLRYDRAFPSTEIDSHRIERGMGHLPIFVESAKAPTVARWESFGWTVHGLVEVAA